MKTIKHAFGCVVRAILVVAAPEFAFGQSTKVHPHKSPTPISAAGRAAWLQENREQCSINEVTLSKPVITYRGTVYPWQCDHMGHMNVMWYVGKFDEASW